MLFRLEKSPNVAEKNCILGYDWLEVLAIQPIAIQPMAIAKDDDDGVLRAWAEKGITTWWHVRTPDGIMVVKDSDVNIMEDPDDPGESGAEYTYAENLAKWRESHTS